MPWTDGLPEEDVGFIANRGWDKLEAPAAALEAIKAYRGASSKLGAPPEELVRFPKDPAAPEWAEVHKRLGRPDTAEGYDFTAIKDGDKPGLDETLATALRGAFHQANLPVSSALRVAQAIADHTAGVAKAKAAEEKVTAEAEQARLDAMWGPHKQTNTFIAERAAQTLGISKEGLDGILKAKGATDTMETLRKLGVQMGEARHITGDGTKEGEGKVVSADQAKQAMAAAMQDRTWRERFARNDAEARGQFQQWTTRIAEANLARR